MDNGTTKSLISPEYRQQQAQLHAKGNYGVMGAEYAALINALIERMGVKHLLDYGCGSNLSLAKNLKSFHKLIYQCYDPGVERFSGPPVPAELVCCLDVLEHIEPDCLEAVLDDLQRLTQAILVATIATGPAGKKLPDGRNAHLIQQPMPWWLPKLWARFDLQSVNTTGNGFLVVAYARSSLEQPDGSVACGS